jgi:branched-chain amino acid transport system substrate-binding protein
LNGGPNSHSSPQFSYDNIFPWAGGQLFAAAAKAVNLSSTSTPADVKNGLCSLKNETLGGVAPPLTFIPGKAALVSCWFLTEVKGGNLVTTDGGKPSCLSNAQVAGLGAALKALG